MAKPTCKKCNSSIGNREMMELDGFCASCANEFMLEGVNVCKKEETPKTLISSVNQARQLVTKYGHLDIVRTMINMGDYANKYIRTDCLRRTFTDASLRDCLFYTLISTPFEYCYKCPDILPHLNSFLIEYLKKCETADEYKTEEDYESDLIDFYLDICEPICQFGGKNKCGINTKQTNEQLKWCFSNYQEYGLEIIARYDKISEKNLRRRRDSIIRNMAALTHAEYEELDYVRGPGFIFEGAETITVKIKEEPKVMFFQKGSIA